MSNDQDLLFEYAFLSSIQIINSELEYEDYVKTKLDHFIANKSMSKFQGYCNSNKLIGFLPISEDFYNRSIQELTQEISQYIDKADSLWHNFLNKRVMLQLHRHHKFLKNTTKKMKLEAPNVIFQTDNNLIMVRVGIQSLFHLIEAISSFIGPQYDTFCSQIIKTTEQTLSNVPPLALLNESDDCIGAFQEFLYKRIQFCFLEPELNADQIQAISCLLNLSIARGKAFLMFKVLDILISFPKNLLLKVSSTIFDRLANLNRNSEYPIPFEISNSLWSIESLEVSKFGFNKSAISDEYPQFIKEHGATSSIATDGIYLYIHFEHGLVKVGTGCNGSIRGHLYASDPNFFPKYHVWSSLIFVSNTLYFSSPMISPGDLQDSNLFDNINSLSNVHILICVCPKTLKRTGEIIIAQSKITQKSRFITDGKHVYLVGSTRLDSKKKKDNVSSIRWPVYSFNGNESDSEPSLHREFISKELENIYMIEIYNLSSGKISDCLHTIELKIPNKILQHIKKSTPSMLNCLPLGNFGITSIYTTGIHLIAMISSNYNGEFNVSGSPRFPTDEIRIFYLKTGKLVGIYSTNAYPDLIDSFKIPKFGLKTTTYGLASYVYDSFNNHIYSFQNNFRRVGQFFNIGARPNRTNNEMNFEGFHLPEFAENTPEAILNHPEFQCISNNEYLNFQDCITILLAHLDRVSRSHFAYYPGLFLDSKRPNIFSPTPYISDLSVESVSILCTILEKFWVNRTFKHFKYCFLVILKLMKINIKDLTFYAQSFSSQDLKTIKNIGKKLIEIQSKISDVQLVEEINEIFINGFNSFFNSEIEKISFIRHSLSFSFFNDHLFQSLAMIDSLGSLISNGQRKESDIHLEKNLSDGINKWQGYFFDFHYEIRPEIVELITNLLDYSVERSIYEIKNGPQNINAYGSDLFLEAIQRYFLALYTPRSTLIYYYNQVVNRCIRLISVALEYMPERNPNIILEVLEHSILYVVLFPLVTGLLRDIHSGDLETVLELDGSTKDLIKSLNIINSSFSELVDSNNIYIKRLMENSQQSTIVQTRHPYIRKNSRNKVFFHNAHAILIRFDQRCKILNNDNLQITFNAGDFSKTKSYTFTHNSWPKNPIIIRGNTVSFVFQANSKERSSELWGWKCYVTSLPSWFEENFFSHWLLDLNNTVASLAVKCASLLLTGGEITKLDTQYEDLFKSGLFKNGFIRNDSLDDSISFAGNSITNELEIFAQCPNPFFDFVKKTCENSRPFFRVNASKALEKAERYVLTAIIYHSNAYRYVKDFSDKDSILDQLSDGSYTWKEFYGKEGFILGKKIVQFLTWMSRCGEIENIWQIAINDKICELDHFEQYFQDYSIFPTLCEMKGVEFTNDMSENTKNLFNKMIEEIRNRDKECQNYAVNPFQVVADVVIERCKFLFQLNVNYQLINVADIVISFCQSPTVSFVEIEAAIRKQTLRAQNRITGLEYFNFLLLHYNNFNTSTSIIHQVLYKLFLELKFHYMDNIMASNALSDSVKDSFEKLFCSVIHLMERPTDSTSKLLSLGILNFQYKTQDVNILSKFHVDVYLRELILSNPKGLLKSAAWTSLILISMRSVQWFEEIKSNYPASQAGNLYYDSFYLVKGLLSLISLLKNLLKIPKKYQYHIFTLIYLMSNYYDIFKDPLEIDYLINFLDKNINLRLQRLILRIFRRLLLKDKEDTHSYLSQDVLFNFIIEKLEKWLKIGHDSSSSLKNSHFKFERIEDSNMESDITDQYNLYVLSIVDFQKFQNAYDLAHFIIPQLSVAELLKIHSIRHEGYYLIKTGPKEEMHQIGAILVQNGVNVQICHTSCDLKCQKPSNINCPEKIMYHSSPWVNGYNATSFASEYVAQARFLLNNSLINPDLFLMKIQKASEALPELDLELGIPEVMWHGLASLYIVSDYPEPIRVCGRVVAESHLNGTEKKITGTIIEYEPILTNKVQVLFDSELKLNAINTLNIRDIKPIPEFQVDLDLFSDGLISIFPKIIYLALYSPMEGQKLKVQVSYFLEQLRAAATNFVLKILHSNYKSRVLNCFQCYIPEFMSNAKKYEKNTSAAQLCRNISILSQRLWDTFNFRMDPKIMHSMRTQLPHLPWAAHVFEYPTKWKVNDLLPLFLWGNHWREVEFPKSSIFPADKEVLIFANSCLPVASDWYFEIIVHRISSNGSVSLGVIPEYNLKTSFWPKESFKFRFNDVMMRLERRYNDVEDMKQRSCIGCGYTYSTKSLYFTKNGEYLDIVYKVQHEMVLLPAISIVQGCKITANFGQESFVYNVPYNPFCESVHKKSIFEKEDSSQKQMQEEESLRKLEKDCKLEETAQPILAMGYTMTQAITALKMTSEIGVVGAVTWLLENPDYKFEDSIDNTEKPSTFNETNHLSYFLPNCYVKEEPGFEEYDDDLVSQQVHSAMASALFVEPLSDEEDISARDGEGVRLLDHVPFELGQFSGNPTREKEEHPPLKPSQLSIGMLVQVGKNPDFEKKSSSNGCDSSIFEDFGFFRGINAKKKLVLLQFVNSENCATSSYWYPIDRLKGIIRKFDHLEHESDSVLYSSQCRSLLFHKVEDEKSKNQFTDSNTGDRDLDLLYRLLTSTYSQLTKAYTNQILLSVMGHQSLSLLPVQGAISVSDLLYLGYSEFLDNEHVIACTHSLFYDLFLKSNAIRDCHASIIESVKGMDSIGKKLFETLSGVSSDRAEELVHFLAEEAIGSFEKNGISNGIHLGSDKLLVDNGYPGVEIIKYSTNTWRARVFDAKFMLVLSNNADKNSGSSESKIQFFSDELGENLVRSFSSAPFMPFIVPGNTMYIQYEGKSSDPFEFNITVVPTSSEICLAIWITDFLLYRALDWNPPMNRIFNAIMNCIFQSSVPSNFKESLVCLATRMVECFRCSHPEHLGSIQLKQLTKLKGEVLKLYKIEKKGNSALFSTYLQNMIELLALVRLIELDHVAHFQTLQDKVPKGFHNESVDSTMNAAMELTLALFPKNDGKMDVDCVDQKRAESSIMSDGGSHDLDPLNCIEIYKFEGRERNNHFKFINENDDDSSLISKNYERDEKGDPIWLDLIVAVLKQVEVFFPQKNFKTLHRDYFLRKFIAPNLGVGKSEMLSKIVLIKFDHEIPGEMVSELEYALVDSFKRIFSAVVNPSSIFLSVSKPNIVIMELENPEKLKNNKNQTKLIVDVNSFSFVGSVFFPFYLRPKFNQIMDSCLMADFGEYLLDYFRKKLVDNHRVITNRFHNFLKEVFCYFSDDHTLDGLMCEEELDRMQLTIINESVTNDVKNYLFQNYETRFNFNNRRGLTFNGFKNVYVVQAIVDPFYTWKEILSLGYNLDLIKCAFSSVDEAIDAVMKLKNPMSTDLELVKYCEEICGKLGFNTPLKLNESHLSSFMASGLIKAYPGLSMLETRDLILRFKFLRNLNYLIKQILPLVNMKADGPISQSLVRCNDLMFHSVKMSFFYDVLDKTSTREPQPTVIINRLKLANRKETEMKVFDESELGNTVFGSAYLQLRHLDPKLLRQKKPQGTEPHFSLKIQFYGENVEGESGPYRQFFTDISKELKTKLPLFVPCPNAQAKIGNNRDKYLIRPSFNSLFALKLYRFLGQLMGMAIRTGVLISLDLPAIFWKSLVYHPVAVSDLKEVDWSFVNSIGHLESCDMNNSDGVSSFGNFRILLSDLTQVLLTSDGDQKSITAENRREFVDLAIRARINESALQVKEIQKGLADLLPLPLLRILTYQDLELKVCGRPFVDIQLLKRHTKYAVGLSSGELHITYFWEVLESFSQEDRRAFVRFAWAQDRLPSDDQEFKRTQTRMFIKPYLGKADPDSTFPKADTCFFNLMLPKYSSLEIMREKLLIAIHTDSDSIDADNPRGHLEDSI